MRLHGMELVRRLDIVDQLRPPAPCQRASRRSRSFAGAGHVTWLDAPDRFWPMIIEF
jgi:hypothetical protein